jgi:hypothetical protein
VWLAAQVLNFDDNTTLNMFGGTVTVVTGDGIDVDDEDAQEHFSEEHAPEVPHAIRAKKAEMSRKASLMASAIKLASLKVDFGTNVRLHCSHTSCLSLGGRGNATYEIRSVRRRRRRTL